MTFLASSSSLKSRRHHQSSEYKSVPNPITAIYLHNEMGACFTIVCFAVVYCHAGSRPFCTMTPPPPKKWWVVVVVVVVDPPLRCTIPMDWWQLTLKAVAWPRWMQTCVHTNEDFAVDVEFPLSALVKTITHEQQKSEEEEILLRELKRSGVSSGGENGVKADSLNILNDMHQLQQLLQEIQSDKVSRIAFVEEAGTGKHSKIRLLLKEVRE
jgi:hypothetical protein